MFAKNGWKVLFISDPISPFHFIDRKNKGVLERYRIYRGLTESGNSNIDIYVPLAIFTPNEKPVFRTAAVANNWYKFTIPNVIKYIKRIGFGKVDLLWFDSITQYFLINEIQSKRSILRIADRMDAFKKSTQSIKKLEKKLMNKADIIIYTAKTLRKYLKGYEDKITYISNGVDIEHFLKSNRNIPEDLKCIPKPIAIYVGAVHEWFGIDFLIEVAKRCRNISFVIIGNVSTNKTKLENISNIFLLGRKDYKEIPGYIFNSDVGIITFNVSHPVVKTVNPIKMYEYMACSLPVVATKWKELELIGSPIHLADSPWEFTKILYNVLKVGKKEKYLKFARANSWEERFKRIIKLIGN